MTWPWPNEVCSVPLPCESHDSSALFALTASEAEQASQGLRSVHGCHVSFCLIHIKVIPSASAFCYAICWFQPSNSTCWEPNCHYAGHQAISLAVFWVWTQFFRVLRLYRLFFFNVQPVCMSMHSFILIVHSSLGSMSVCLCVCVFTLRVT